MRKNMTKEVTKTTVKLAKMETENGMPVAVPMEDEILLGNVSLEKAQKKIAKEYGGNVTVFQVVPDTTVYEMAVEDFIKHASIKEDETDDSEQSA